MLVFISKILFFSFGAIDISGLMSLCWWGGGSVHRRLLLGIPGPQPLHASSNFSRRTIKNVSRYCPVAPGRQKSPPERGTSSLDHSHDRSSRCHLSAFVGQQQG